MKLEVEVDRRPALLEWTRDGETCRFRFESEEEKTAGVLPVEPGTYSVLVDGVSFEAKVEEGGDAVYVSVGGRRFEVKLNDPRRWAGGRRGVEAHGRQDVTAPMPGKVVRVLVAEGDHVECGQGLVVVEAMKMQNEMKAARSGHVRSVAAAAGATVNAGDILVTIE